MDTKQKMEKFIQRELALYYKNNFGGDMDRELITLKSKDGASEDVYFYFLQGSPPKGYAIYCKGQESIYFYDLNGKKFKKYNSKGKEETKYVKVKIKQIIITENKLECDINNNDDNRIYGLGENGKVYEWDDFNNCWHLDHKKAIFERNKTSGGEAIYYKENKL